VRAEQFSVLGPQGQLPPPKPWEPDSPIAPWFTPIGGLIHAQIVVSSGIGPETVQGGIIIPETVKWVTPVCRAIAVGPEVKQIKAGDYFHYSMVVQVHEIRHDEKATIVVHENGTFGTINPGPFLDYLKSMFDPKPAEKWEEHCRDSGLNVGGDRGDDQKV